MTNLLHTESHAILLQFALNKKLMQIEIYLLTKSMVLTITCCLVSPIFQIPCINTLKQSLTLTNTLLEKLKLDTLDCYGDFEDLHKY